MSMKRSDLSEIKKMAIKTILDRVKKDSKELLDLKLQKNIGKLANLKAVKTKKTEIAQLLTILNQKISIKELEDDGK